MTFNQRIKRYGVITGGIVAIIAVAIVAFVVIRNSSSTIESSHENVILVRTNNSPAPVIKRIGTLLPGETKVERFVIQNKSEGPLRLVKATPTCGCTRVVIDREQVDPGGEIIADITVKAPDFAPKKLSISVVFQFALGRDMKNMVVELTGEVENILVVGNDAGVIDLGDIPLNQLPYEATYKVNRGNHPLQWNSVRCEAERIDGYVVQANLHHLSKHEWALQINLNESRCLGILEVPLRFIFAADDAEYDRVLVRTVRAKVVGAIRSSPSSVYLGEVFVSHPVEAKINLLPVENNFSGEVRIVRITDNGLGNVVFDTPKQHGVYWEIPFSVTSSIPYGQVKGNIEITLLIGEEEMTMVVPYLGFTKSNANQ